MAADTQRGASSQSAPPFITICWAFPSPSPKSFLLHLMWTHVLWFFFKDWFLLQIHTERRFSGVKVDILNECCNTWLVKSLLLHLESIRVQRGRYGPVNGVIPGLLWVIKSTVVVLVRCVVARERVWPSGWVTTANFPLRDDAKDHLLLLTAWESVLTISISLTFRHKHN